MEAELSSCQVTVVDQTINSSHSGLLFSLASMSAAGDEATEAECVRSGDAYEKSASSDRSEGVQIEAHEQNAGPTNRGPRPSSLMEAWTEVAVDDEDSDRGRSQRRRSATMIPTRIEAGEQK